MLTTVADKIAVIENKETCQNAFLLIKGQLYKQMDIRSC